MHKMCAVRGLDQTTLAQRVRLSKSTISRILSGSQEPKLGQAFAIARALGVTLDYLVDETADFDETQRMVMVTEEEVTILKLVRRLGGEVALDRLLTVAPAQAAKAEPGSVPTSGTAQSRGDSGASRGIRD